MRTARVLVGDVRDVLQRLPSESVHCVVTSPPYWGLRDYGIPPSIWKPADLRGGPDCESHEWGDELRLHKGGPHGDGVMLGGSRAVVDAQAAVKEIRAGAFCSSCGAWRGCLGLEPTFELYVEHMVEVFADVHRVLRPEGTLWLNLGDCYATGAGGECPGGGEQGSRWAGTGGSRGERHRALRDGTHAGKHTAMAAMGPMTQPNRMPQPGLKPKDLVGIPWRVAFALQADGWWLRSDVIWSKPNPMPESVTDRPTKAHEYLFLLAKSERYFYDKDAILEGFADERMGRDGAKVPRERDRGGRADGFTKPNGIDPSANGGRNKRSVWPIATQPYAGAHFAVMPEALAEPCILAGTSEKGACARCGAPWERESRREFVPQQDVATDKGVRGAFDQKPLDASNRWQGFPRGTTSSRTLGWFPSCECGEQQTRPCVVLDPFAGSGTVGVVALRRGREFLGAELNPAYAQLAHDRIEDDAPLLNRAEVGT